MEAERLEPFAERLRAVPASARLSDHCDRRRRQGRQDGRVSRGEQRTEGSRTDKRGEQHQHQQQTGGLGRPWRRRSQCAHGGLCLEVSTPLSMLYFPPVSTHALVMASSQLEGCSAVGRDAGRNASCLLACCIVVRSPPFVSPLRVAGRPLHRTRPCLLPLDRSGRQRQRVELGANTTEGTATQRHRLRCPALRRCGNTRRGTSGAHTRWGRQVNRRTGGHTQNRIAWMAHDRTGRRTDTARQPNPLASQTAHDGRSNHSDLSGLRSNSNSQHAHTTTFLLAVTRRTIPQQILATNR